MLNGIQFPANLPIDLATWRRVVREGQCGMFLRGYSHIFVSGPSNAAECSDFAAVADSENSYQEVFSRTRLRELVLSYWKRPDPMPIRRAVAGEDIWKEQAYRKPSERIQVFHKHMRKDDSSNEVTPPSGGNVGKASEAAVAMPSKPRAPTTPILETHSAASTNEAPVKWAYPGVGALLANYEGETHDTQADAEWLRQTENSCKGALQQFQLQSKLLGSALTPNAALLKFQGSATLTVEQVVRRRSEFLTTHKLNVISVRAEPGVVAITIARPNRRVLHLPEVWRRWSPDCSHGNHKLLIAVKEEDSGLLFLSPKSNAPHTLIAGSTGSGKSVLMQNIVLGIACTNTPAQARIILIDPKLGVDYFAFEGLPHLQGGVIECDQAPRVARLLLLATDSLLPYSLSVRELGNRPEVERKVSDLAELLVDGLRFRALLDLGVPSSRITRRIDVRLKA